MDWSATLNAVMDGVISIGVTAGVVLLKQYTGYQATAAQQQLIKDKATQLAHQAVAAAEPGIEQAVIRITDPIVTQRVPQMINDLAAHGVTVSAEQAAAKIQAALGATQVAAPTVDVKAPA